MYNCVMSDSARGESLLSQAILEVQTLRTNLITPPHSTTIRTTSTESTPTYSHTTEYIYPGTSEQLENPFNMGTRTSRPTQAVAS